MHPMQLKYRLFRKGSGIYFLEDRDTKKQESLRTREEAKAQRVPRAKAH